MAVRRLPSATAPPDGNDEGDDPPFERLVVRVDELDQDLVRPRRETVDDERLAARVRPAPGRVIHGHVDVSDARRHIEGVRAEHGHDSQVLRAVLDDDASLRKPLRKRGAGSLASGTTGAGPRMSLAVCAIAVDAYRTAATPIKPMEVRLMIMDCSLPLPR